MIKFLIFTVSLVFASHVYAGVSSDELLEGSVQIIGKDSGGSGVIYRSYPHSSFVLTNAHVCDIGKRNTLYVLTNKNEKHIADSYKTSKIHDICVIKVLKDLNYNTKLAKSEASVGENLIVSGHPFLFPTMISKGYKSNSIIFNMLVKVVACTEKERKNKRTAAMCFWMGGLPVIKTVVGDTSSNLIAGGSSGSPVFDSSQDLVGLVFAGAGRGMSPAIIVPHAHLVNFLKKEVKVLPWIKNKVITVYGRTNIKNKKINTRVIKNLDSLKKLDLVFPAIKSKSLNRIIIKYNNIKW